MCSKHNEWSPRIITRTSCCLAMLFVFSTDVLLLLLTSLDNWIEWYQLTSWKSSKSPSCSPLQKHFERERYLCMYVMWWQAWFYTIILWKRQNKNKRIKIKAILFKKVLRERKKTHLFYFFSPFVRCCQSTSDIQYWMFSERFTAYLLYR